MGHLQSRGDRLFDGANILLLGLITLIVLYPLIFVLSASFSNPAYILEGRLWLWPKGLTLTSYERVFQNPFVITGYLNTLRYTLIGTTLNVVLTICAAYPLSRKDFAGRGAFTVYFTVTMFFSGGLIPTYLLIKSLGLINSFWAVILPGAVSMWNIIIMRTFFQNIPVEIQESAHMDGCSNLRLLVRIVLPLSLPVVAVMVLFYGVGHWNAFFNALMYVSEAGKHPLQLVMRGILLQNQMGAMVGASEGSVEQIVAGEGVKYAIIVVASAPILVLYPLLQRYFVKGVMIGAIKG
ncbi:carbohydrate ABC transporter permease [Paenibacillus thalictri]|uniref:Carbohydrate ABC transporter permease n=1 Tax=Paenibacillus thalictri TaxID=2527873 RepID=A0A4Q9DFH8_9BACL|nr:carbohydrate ABC transporter permease [Paenibacillus thalictri]TBL70735.1 carbohydrate ABC transporter permease [Paenibacillus thalictri]